jgi:hypothetical protein
VVLILPGWIIEMSAKWPTTCKMFTKWIADHSSKESYRLCKNDYGTEEEARTQQRAVESLMNEWMNEWRLVFADPSDSENKPPFCSVWFWQGHHMAVTDGVPDVWKCLLSLYLCCIIPRHASNRKKKQFISVFSILKFIVLYTLVGRLFLHNCRPEMTNGEQSLK